MVTRANFIVLIQARLNSTQLKSKILCSFFNISIIERIIKIAKALKIKKKIYIISGNKKRNLLLKNIAKKMSIEIFFDNEKNVLKRFQNLIIKKKLYNKNIIRITSDNYLIQPLIIDKMVKEFLKHNVDYCYIKPLSHFSGEIFKSKLLFLQNDNNSMNKEHVTYEMRNSRRFKVLGLPSNFFNINHKKYFTLDRIEDLYKMKKIELKFPKLKKLNCIEELKKIQKK